MSVQAFVDESKRRGIYLVCAVLIDPKELAHTRASLRAMRLPQQRRLHFSKESSQRRQFLLEEVARLPVRAWVYSSTAKEPYARQEIMAALLNELSAVDCERLIIERREAGQDARESAQIAAASRGGQVPAEMSYDHLSGHEEPLLWVADAVAWAYGAGGQWRRRSAKLIECALSVDSRR